MNNWKKLALALALMYSVRGGDAPVTFEGNTLFTITQRVGSFGPEDRARNAERKLLQIAEDYSLQPQAIAVSHGEDSSDIVAGDVVITSVTGLDAATAKKPRRALAEDLVNVIRTAVTQYRAEHSARGVARATAIATAATILLGAILYFLAWLFRNTYEKLHAWKGSRIRGPRTARKISTAAIEGLRFLHLAIGFALFAVYFPIVFSQFPQTRGYTNVLLIQVKTLFEALYRSAIGVIPNLIMIVLIGILTRYVIKFTRFLFGEIGNGSITFAGFYPEWASPTYKIVRFLALALGLVMAFPYIPGSDSAAFKGLSIFFGVLFSLGSSGAISNVVSGVVLTYTRSFHVGDRVKIGDTVGDVLEKNLIITRIRTIKNEIITVPNATVIGSHVINYSSEAYKTQLILHTGVSIGYDVPWRTVHQLLLDAALSTANVLSTPSPFVLQTSMDDFYVQYQINAYTDDPHRMVIIYSELRQNIQDKFNEAGVEICSPHFATLRDGNAIAIPEEYRAANYKAGAFRVAVDDQGR